MPDVEVLERPSKHVWRSRGRPLKHVPCPVRAPTDFRTLHEIRCWKFHFQLPLESGWPDEAREALDEYEAICPNHECATTTSRAPFAVPGSDWVFADVYARLGDRDRALALYDRALAWPDAASWPAREGLVAERAALDERMAFHAEAGDAQAVFMDMSSNGAFACVMCHQPAASRGLPAPFAD